MTRVVLCSSVIAATLLTGCCYIGREKKEESQTSNPVFVTNPNNQTTPAQQPPLKLNTPQALPGEIPDIPETRSNPPTVSEWSAAAEVNTQDPNSRAPNCFQKVVREWLKIHCEGNVVRVDEKVGFGTQNVDHYESVVPGKYADYIVRLRRGNVIQAKIYRTEGNAAIFVNWPAGASKPVHIAMGRGS